MGWQLAENSSGGGQVNTTWKQQFYTFSSATQVGAITLDTPVAMRVSDGIPSTANVSVTNSGQDLNFLTTGQYFVKLYAQIGKNANNSGQRGLFWAVVISGTATVNFFTGANLGTAAGTTESNVVDTIIPITVTVVTATINFLLSTLTGNPNGNQLELQAYPGASNTPASPSLAIEVFKEVQV